MSEVELSMSIPLDSDGFARRACPNCERELKWIISSDGEEATPAPEGGYFCPYCGGTRRGRLLVDRGADRGREGAGDAGDRRTRTRAAR